jgi:hypothetical protein
VSENNYNETDVMYIFYNRINRSKSCSAVLTQLLSFLNNFKCYFKYNLDVILGLKTMNVPVTIISLMKIRSVRIYFNTGVSKLLY